MILGARELPQLTTWQFSDNQYLKTKFIKCKDFMRFFIIYNENVNDHLLDKFTK